MADYSETTQSTGAISDVGGANWLSTCLMIIALISDSAEVDFNVGNKSSILNFL